MDEPETEAEQQTTQPPGPCAAGDCIVVGVGASAGGLEAFQRFLKHMPPHPRIALVYVQHLDPRHESVLPELLARDAKMPVQAVQDETSIEGGCVYVIPPNTSLRLERGVLRLGPRPPQPEFGKPIDGFMDSLAKDLGENCVGIILSGTGSDGTMGLRAVKEHGGMTIAQLPESAAYDSMPRSAIAAGLMDYVLPPEDMPARLIEHADQTESLREDAETSGKRLFDDGAVERICEIVRTRTGHDFASYKRNTLVRRISLRMGALEIQSAAEYLDRLERDPKEALDLLQYMLIGVTDFFRDPEAFNSLAQQVIPRLFEGKGASDQVRLWVVGCASGEEVYSLAILLCEQAAREATPPRIQIFATDIDEPALEVARRGSYPQSIGERISQDRLERFFTREDGAYRVKKELRQMVVFSKHNLLHDPPFPDLDFISCRNLLIYLDSGVQGRAISLFHYALRTGGFLFLGAAETISGRPDLFDPAQRSQRIYRRRDVATRAPIEYPITWRSSRIRAGSSPEVAFSARSDATLQRSLERLILEEYTPAGMVVRGNGDVVYLFGPTARYLALPAGAPSLNAFSLVRKRLRTELRSALVKAAREKEPVVLCGLDMKLDERTAVNLVVGRFAETGPDPDLYVIIFQDVVISVVNEPGAAPEAREASAQLEHQLRSTREQLQATIDEFESANQELQSTNEELLSMNEELQSANEELQSSKEEVQTVNSELESVNRELAHKLDELDIAKSDLESLFEGTQVATVFLDNNLHIKRFTPTATELFRLRRGDVGRPVTDITARFTDGDTVGEIREVVRTLQRKEIVVTRVDADSRYLMRILPYRTRQNVIDGVVITFIDITDLTRAQEELSNANRDLERKVAERTAALEEASRRKDEFLGMLSHELRNPLSAITSSIELWRLRGAADPVLDRAANIAQRQLAHMRRLLDDLLDTARITRGMIELHRRAVDIRQIVKDAIDMAAPLASDKKQEIAVSVPEEPLTIEGDPDRLQQAVGNLLTNAQKYTPPGGHIAVSAAVDQDRRAVIRVSDDGIGIQWDLLSRIFDTFSQAKRTPDRSQGGLGLGLTLVRHIVELHGGSIEAHSAGEGKGSEFVVRLPLSSKPMTAPGTRGSNAGPELPTGTAVDESFQPATQNHGRRILVVEDNEDAAELLSTILKIDGNEVRAAHNGPEALSVSTEWHPEVVLLDIGLPGMDGYEVARRLRQEPGLSDLMLVALTGYGQEEDRQRVREAGFAHHLVKPVDLDAMKRVLQKTSVT
jgi:two-component system, chemotaxis family, CheB/CheR fusion protein